MNLPRVILLILLAGGSAGCRSAELSRGSIAGLPGRATLVALDAVDSRPAQTRPQSLEPARGRTADTASVVRPVSWSEIQQSPQPELCHASCAPAFNMREDIRNFGPTLWQDAQGLVNVENGLILGVSLAAAIGIRQDLDDRVRESVADRPERWGDATRILGYVGEAPYQVPVLMALWGYSVHANDSRLHDFSSALISAYTINGLATLAIKGITDTERPDADWNGGRWGFPSFHASSAFTIGAVIEEYYGWGAGLPVYTLAGLIGWSRIDAQDHDLSDVVFGAAMGWVIGKSVASTHLTGDGRVQILPWKHPVEPAVGMAVQTRF